MGRCFCRSRFGAPFAWYRDGFPALGGEGAVWYGDPGWWCQTGLILLMGVLTLVLIVSFGVTIPKRVAAANPKAWCYAFSRR